MVRFLMTNKKVLYNVSTIHIRSNMNSRYYYYPLFTCSLYSTFILRFRVNYLQIIEQHTLRHNLTRLVIQTGITTSNELIIDVLKHSNLLPLLTNQADIVKINDYWKSNEFIKYGYFIYQDKQDNTIIATNDLTTLRSRLNTVTNIKLITKQDFFLSLEENFKHLNIIKSKYFLEFYTKSYTAKNIRYRQILGTFLVIYFILLQNYTIYFHIITNGCFFLQNILKFMLFMRTYLTTQYLESNVVNSSGLINNITVDENASATWQYTKHLLPVYTILLPLYKEVDLLPVIIQNISNLNYPKDKLDVKVVIEEDDYVMIKEVLQIDLPFFMHIVRVPATLPRTKPKALNYAMQYARGEYTVVYDAEDKPAPDQLLKAISLFQVLPPTYICLQAKLNFYNQDENILARLLSIEYSLWFEYMLVGLSLLNLPVTLGGTSNHFKTDILHKIGGWDAYNVAEDADLGIRIYTNGYKVYMLDSDTLEESPISIGNWINQRSRWIKGFLQTFFVFLTYKEKRLKLTFWQIFSVYVFVGLSSYCFFCLPFILLSIITNSLGVINYLWIINGIFSFTYLYSSAFYIIIKKSGAIGNIKIFDIITFILWPFYFLLHSLACYKAVLECMCQPFFWNKTKHKINSQNNLAEKF